MENVSEIDLCLYLAQGDFSSVRKKLMSLDASSDEIKPVLLSTIGSAVFLNVPVGDILCLMTDVAASCEIDFGDEDVAKFVSSAIGAHRQDVAHEVFKTFGLSSFSLELVVSMQHDYAWLKLVSEYASDDVLKQSMENHADDEMLKDMFQSVLLSRRVAADTPRMARGL